MQCRICRETVDVLYSRDLCGRCGSMNNFQQQLLLALHQINDHLASLTERLREGE